MPLQSFYELQCIPPYRSIVFLTLYNPNSLFFKLSFFVVNPLSNIFKNSELTICLYGLDIRIYTASFICFMDTFISSLGLDASIALSNKMPNISINSYTSACWALRVAPIT